MKSKRGDCSKGERTVAAAQASVAELAAEIGLLKKDLPWAAAQANTTTDAETG